MKQAGQGKFKRVGRHRWGRRAGFETLEDRRLLATLFVDVHNLTKVEDGTAAHPYHLIQAGIDHSAAAGDLVSVAPGLYPEAIRINKSIALVGPNAGVNPITGVRGPEATIVPPVDNPYAGVNILVAADAVTIDGFVVDGHSDVLGGGVSLNGISVNAKSGVSSVDSVGNQMHFNGMTVQNDVIRNFTRFGVIGDADNYSSPLPWISTGNAIRNNLIDNMPTLGTVPVGSPDQGRGISIEDNFYADVTGNVITRAATGIQTIFDLARNPTGVTSKISNNEVHAYDRGILIYTLDTDTRVFEVTNNKVFADQGVGTTATAVGIDFERVLSGTLVSVVNNDVNGFHVGIKFGYSPTTQGVAVSGGTLSSNDIGVLLTNAGLMSGASPLAVRATLTGLTVKDSRVTGLQVADALNQATAAVTLSVGGGTTITGNPHGASLTGTYEKLVETIAPTVAFTATPPLQTTLTSATFAFAANDDLSTPNDLGLRYNLDSGAWQTATSPINLTGLSSGMHTIVVEATDQAGNKGTAAYSWTVAITSLLPPPIPSTPNLDPASDSGASSSDGVTRVNTPTFTGTATPGLQVNILAGTTNLGKVTADSLGNWKFTVGGSGSTTTTTLADGVYAITATATNSVGSTSAASPILTITVDRTAPTVTLSTSVLTPGIFGPPQVPVVFSGKVTDALSGPSDLSFSIMNSSGTVIAMGTPTIASDGTYRVMVMLDPAVKKASLTKRTYTVTFTSHDVAGNTGTTSGSFVLPRS